MGASKYGASFVAVTGLVICYTLSFAPFVVVPKFVFATVVMAPGLDYLHTYMYRPFRTIRYVRDRVRVKIRVRVRVMYRPFMTIRYVPLIILQFSNGICHTVPPVYDHQVRGGTRCTLQLCLIMVHI